MSLEINIYTASDTGKSKNPEETQEEMKLNKRWHQVNQKMHPVLVFW